MCKWKIEVLLCDLVLAVVINTSAMLLGGEAFSFQSWYPGVASAFFTNVLLQLVLPVPGFAQSVTAWAHDASWRFIVQVFAENFVFVTCISFTMAVLQTPAGSSIVSAWLATYVQLLLVGYVTSLVLFAVQKRTGRI